MPRRGAGRDRSPFAQALAELGEGVMQPPPGGAAEGTHACGLLVEHGDRDDGLAAIDGRAQSRVVREAEVVAEPDETRGCGHGSIMPVRPAGRGLACAPSAG